MSILHIIVKIVKIPENRNLLGWPKLPIYCKLIILHVNYLTFETLCYCYIDNAKQSRKSNKVQLVIIIIGSNK